jgi:hypothetical protein
VPRRRFGPYQIYQCADGHGEQTQREERLADRGPCIALQSVGQGRAPAASAILTLVNNAAWSPRGRLERGIVSRMAAWEWQLAAAIVAAPFIFFGLFELIAYRRRRRAKAIAQRPKGRRAKKFMPW